MGTIISYLQALFPNDGYHTPNVRPFVPTAATLAREESIERCFYLDQVHDNTTEQVLELVGDRWASFTLNPGYHNDFRTLIRLLCRNKRISSVKMDHAFLSGMSASHQEKLFWDVAQLQSLHSWRIACSPDCPSTVNVPALCRALQNTRCSLRSIRFDGLELKSDVHVQELGKGIALVHGDHSLVLKDIFVDTKGVNANFLDPVLHALTDSAVDLSMDPNYRHNGFKVFSLSCCNNEPDGPSLVGVSALDTFLQHIPCSNIDLRGLGLTDGHCLVLGLRLACEAAPPVAVLDLRRNPGIGQACYEAMAAIVSRNPANPQILVDDPTWAAKFEIARDMNRYCGRKSYLRKGAFAFKEDWLDFLGDVVGITAPRKLDYLFYTIRENPCFLAA